MKNNTIRLTENQLHQIIKESVKTILTELDPRTYASYAQKRDAQGQTEKAIQGREAAVNAWNQQYGKNFNQNKYNNGEVVGTHSGYAEMQPTKTDTYNVHSGENYWDSSNPNARRAYKRTDSFSAKYGNEKYVHNGLTGDNNVDYVDKNHDYHDEGLNAANQMAHGNGTYIKGKGWQ